MHKRSRGYLNNEINRKGRQRQLISQSAKDTRLGYKHLSLFSQSLAVLGLSDDSLLIFRVLSYWSSSGDYQPRISFRFNPYKDDFYERPLSEDYKSANVGCPVRQSLVKGIAGFLAASCGRGKLRLSIINSLPGASLKMVHKRASIFFMFAFY